MRKRLVGSCLKTENMISQHPDIVIGCKSDRVRLTGGFIWQNVNIYAVVSLRRHRPEGFRQSVRGTCTQKLIQPGIVRVEYRIVPNYLYPNRIDSIYSLHFFEGGIESRFVVRIGCRTVIFSYYMEGDFDMLRMILRLQCAPRVMMRELTIPEVLLSAGIGGRRIFRRGPAFDGLGTGIVGCEEHQQKDPRGCGIPLDELFHCSLRCA